MQRRQMGALLGAAGLGMALPAWVQRPAAAGRIPPGELELTVPFPAGGNSALLAKTLVRQFRKETSQAMRLEYRGGAGGTAGAGYVAKAPADGLHLLMGGSSMLVSRALLLQLDVDLYEDFAPLALVAEMPLVLLVNPRRLNTRSWPELLAELRRRPQRYRYASAGVGSSNHVVGEWFKHETGALLEHVPYKGSGPAMLDVIQGNAELMIDGLGSALPHLQADRLRAAFVTSAERSPLLPDVPTARELGLTDFQTLAWYGIFAPKATPQAVQAQLIEVFRSMSQAPAVRQAWQAVGTRWPGLYGADFARFLQEEMKHWAGIVRQTGAAARP
ncbi:Bug family tripartite tricarboxylate transporter substrate binding protein [Comamonas sp. GB3 AK4-5]|uniref:Bug family tripartite tricarboxylate transporter substrate binding protein n=1 Tax=Comamonas sp. GB3 AK4-5 TaxID=3231487 RepID=UPI00351DBAA3